MKRSSLKNKVWLYLSIFSLTILGGIWFLQILSLDIYYEWSKGREIKQIANKVVNAYASSDYSDILDNLAFRNDVCIEITENNVLSYTTDSISRGCLINDSNEIKKYKLQFMLGKNKFIKYKVVNPKFDNKTLVYGVRIDDNTFAFISTSLEPVGSTVSVLKTQLIYIIIIVLIIAFLISYTISKKISKPIEKITEVSKELSKGNYGVTFDIKSEIKEINGLESALNEMSMELSKTETLRRELLANVSHDLKTPLTLIKANSEMVRDLSYKDKDKREKNLNTIIEEVDRLNLLVEDVLDLSKMQSNAVKLDIEEFNLSELIISIIRRFDVLCEKEGYVIEFNGFDMLVKADKKKMEQVMYNLINNAINYTGEDKKIFVNMINNRDVVRVEFVDTGTGIDEQDINYIWDKYYKVDKKYKRVTYGTGLGLSIVKNILMMHDFNYGVESEKGKGSKFYFEIKSQKNQKCKKAYF